MEINVPYYDFRSGVLTRKLNNRPDLGIYKSGVLVGHNFLTELQGPTFYRPGFLFVRKTRRRKKPFFLPFVFNDSQAYVLEFTDKYLRFYMGNGVVTEDAKSIEGITNADPGVITITGHGYNTGDEVFIDSAVGLTELNGAYYLVKKLSNDTFSLTDDYGTDIDTTDFGTWSSGGTCGRVYEISTPYAEADLSRIQIAGRFDLRYLTLHGYMPRKLIRSGHTSWTLGMYIRTGDPFDQKAITGITKANPGVVTSTAHGLVNGDEVLIEEVGGMTEVNQHVFTVTKLTNDTYSIGVNTTGYTTYTSGGFGTKYGNQPRAVGVYGGRLSMGGTLNDPDIMHGSKGPSTTTGEAQFDDFTPGSAVIDGYTYPLTAIDYATICDINFFAGTRDFLFVGTYGGALKVDGGSNGAPITGVDIESKPIDAFGIDPVLPAVFGTDILYVQRGGKALLSLRYSWEEDGYASYNENIQSDEILSAGVTQLAYTQGNPSVVWASLGNGQLASLLYKKTEDISAWNSHDTDGVIATICAQPQDNNYDRLWIGAERDVNGTGEYFVEYSAINPQFLEPDDLFTGDRTADTTTFDDLQYEIQRLQVYLDAALVLDTTQSVAITPSATIGSDIEFNSASPIFVSGTDIGRWIEVKHLIGGERGIAEITSVISGSTVLCKIHQAFLTSGTIPAGAWYLTKNEVLNLGMFEGREIAIVADGNVAPRQTVVNGRVTLPAQSAVTIVGIPYTGRIKTMQPELLLSSGITVGKNKSVNKVALYFRNTLGVAYGYDPYNLTRLSFLKSFSRRPPIPFTGSREVPGFDKWGLSRSFYIVQNEPRPCTIMGIVLDTEVNFEE